MKNRFIFHNKRLTLFFILILVIPVLLVYYQVTNHTFISFDDPDYVTANHRVQQGLTPENIVWAFSFSKEGDKTYFHPLTWLSHMTDCQLFGLNPAYHHLTNLFFHIVNSFLLFMLLKISTGLPYRSLAVAVLFALHPICVDTVAWVAERKNLLSSFFWFLTMLAYVWHTKKPGIIRYMAVFVLFILGLLSKPMLVTIPCVLLLMDFWPLKRFKPVDIRSAIRDGAGLIKEKIPLFALSFFWSILSMLSIQRLGVEVPTYSRPMDLRISNAIVSYVNYIGKILWPFDLAIFYPYPRHVPFWEIAFALLVLISISYVVFKKIKESPWLAVGWLWFLGTLVPVLGLTQNGLWPALADRWAYIPSVGIFIMAVWGVVEAINRIKMPPTLSTALAVIAFFVIVPTTWVQVRYWSTNYTLFQHALDVTENNWAANNNLGKFFSKQKMFNKAVHHFKTANAMMPDQPITLTNIGVALSNLGKDKEAAHYYKQAIQLNKNYKTAHYNLGLLYASQGDEELALQYYQNAIQIDPDYEDAHNNMGLLYFNQGQTDNALLHFQKAIQTDTDNAKSHNNLGLLFYKMGETEQSLMHYQKAIQIDPEFAEAHFNLGLLFYHTGNTKKAEEHYNTSIHINPNYAEAYNNLGLLYSDLEKTDEAIHHFQKATQLDPDYDAAYCNMGVVYSNLGQTPDAVSCITKAIVISPRNVKYYNHLGIILEQAGHTDQAINTFNKALEIIPDDPTTHINLGNLFIKRGQTKKAILHFNTALRSQPDSVEAHNNLGTAFAESGKFKKAIAHYKKALELNPDYVDAHHNLGIALYKVGDVEEAVRHFRKALSIAPERQDVRMNLNSILKKMIPSGS